VLRNAARTSGHRLARRGGDRRLGTLRAGCHGRARLPHRRGASARRGGLRPLRDGGARQGALGFKGIKIENDGCGDFEVEIDGADRQADRSSFAEEAKKAGFPVTFEQTAPPLEYRQGQVVGVFASKRTIAEANSLMWRLSAHGFLYTDLARTPTRWLVVLPQVPVKHALSIAHEVATVGFRIAFRSGVKP
jgi:hypothetical protein